MFIPRTLDKTLILTINCTSVILACCIVLFTLYTFIDFPSASNGYWGVGTVAQRIANLYVHFPL